jgi:hypothetical protein
MRKELLKDRAANFHFAHSILLALEVIIFQARKAYAILDLTEVKYNNNKLSIVEKSTSMHV